MSTTAIIIPNYNYANYIEEAIQSVLEQEVPPTELLIIDDGSTDSTRKILSYYENKIRIVYNEKNLGIVENFRKAVNLTSADYVAFVGADNIAQPNFVKELKYALDQNKKAGVAYFDMEIFGPRAKDLAEKVGAKKLEGGIQPGFIWRFPDPTPEAIQRLSEDNFINGSSMFRRTAYDAVGGYRHAHGPEDADLFFRMVSAGFGAVRVAKPLLRYRQHSVGQANTVLISNMIIEQQKKALEDAWRELARVSDWANSLHNALIDANKWARHLEAEIRQLRPEQEGLANEGLENESPDG